jgi:glycerophosphoryl diester phosphodiesterase
VVQLTKKGGSVDALHGRWDFVTASQVEHARALAYPCYVWTVNTEDEIRGAVGLAPDGIVSNFPDRAIEAVRNARKTGNQVQA